MFSKTRSIQKYKDIWVWVTYVSGQVTLKFTWLTIKSCIQNTNVHQCALRYENWQNLKKLTSSRSAHPPSENSPSETLPEFSQQTSLAPDKLSVEASSELTPSSEHSVVLLSLDLVVAKWSRLDEVHDCSSVLCPVFFGNLTASSLSPGWIAKVPAPASLR